MTALLSYKHRNIKGTDYGLSGENMIKIDLITGFLGSGKTTFIKKYASYLLKKGMNIGILENDFGAVNVDMMLLKELERENCELEMIAGGCDRETHRRRFKTKLIAMGMCGYDRVIVEPSGIFDVDEFFDALYEEPLDRWYEIGNVITIVCRTGRNAFCSRRIPSGIRGCFGRLCGVQQSMGSFSGKNKRNNSASESGNGSDPVRQKIW